MEWQPVIPETIFFNKRCACLATNKLTFNSSTGPKHSVIGDIMNAPNTMANVTFVVCMSLSSPNSSVGSASFSHSTGAVVFKRWIWFLTICFKKKTTLTDTEIKNENWPNLVSTSKSKFKNHHFIKIKRLLWSDCPNKRSLLTNSKIYVPLFQIRIYIYIFKRKNIVYMTIQRRYVASWIKWNLKDLFYLSQETWAKINIK